MLEGQCPSLFGTTSNSLTSVFKVAKPKTVQPFVPPVPRQKKKSRVTFLDTRDYWSNLGRRGWRRKKSWHASWRWWFRSSLGLWRGERCLSESGGQGVVRRGERIYHGQSWAMCHLYIMKQPPSVKINMEQWSTAGCLWLNTSNREILPNPQAKYQCWALSEH